MNDKNTISTSGLNTSQMAVIKAIENGWAPGPNINLEKMSGFSAEAVLLLQQKGHTIPSQNSVIQLELAFAG